MSDKCKYKAGDKLVLTGVSSVFGATSSMLDIIDKKLVGVVNGTGTHYLGGTRYIQITYRDTAPIIPQAHAVVITDEDTVRRATKDDEKHTLEIIKAHNVEVEKIVKTLRKPREGYTTRKVVHPALDPLQVMRNAVILGSWDQANNTFKSYSFYPNTSVCCSFTNNLYDMEIYIPKIWLDAHQYSQADILSYLTFLTKCEIGFEYSFEGLKSLPKTLQGVVKPLPEMEYEYVKENPKTFSLIPYEKDYYCIRIKGDNKTSRISYMRFILVRYLYNTQYWSIPVTAMQIKRTLGAKVTHWEALMIAHLRKHYYNYYCLVANNGNYICNPFQTPESVLKALRSGKTSMNTSFQYVNASGLKNPITEKMFEKKQYLEIYNSLKELKTIKK